eukprot:m.104214 g.104214  ORF g.104214 m.104214 type:complete len:66 (+) comp9106_c0_seq1:1305-1502(+)
MIPQTSHPKCFSRRSLNQFQLLPHRVTLSIVSSLVMIITGDLHIPCKYEAAKPTFEYHPMGYPRY